MTLGFGTIDRSNRVIGRSKTATRLPSLSFRTHTLLLSRNEVRDPLLLRHQRADSSRQNQALRNDSVERGALHPITRFINHSFRCEGSTTTASTSSSKSGFTNAATPTVVLAG